METQPENPPQPFSAKDSKIVFLAVVVGVIVIITIVLIKVLPQQNTSVPSVPTPYSSGQKQTKTPPALWGIIRSTPVSYTNANERLLALAQETKHLPAIDPRRFFIPAALSIPSDSQSLIFRGVLRKVDAQTLTVETWDGLIPFQLMNGNSAQTTTSVFVRNNLISYDGHFIKLRQLQSAELNQAIQAVANTTDGKVYRVELFGR